VLPAAFHSLQEPGPDSVGNKVVPQSRVNCGRHDVGARRQVANAQCVILQQILLLFRECEQRFALRGGQEFTTGHQTILTMNKAFENCDRSGFSRFDDQPQL
jgi:hypothetical protein